MQTIIGIESSANKVGVGIVTDNELIANTRATFYGGLGEGFRPQEVARHHQKILPDLIDDAIKQAGIEKGDDITAIAYTKGPGMGAPLQAGTIAAQVLAMTLGVPLIPVNHCIAHAEMGRTITKTHNPVILYVSGGNTQILTYARRKYYIIGETLDIAAGNCIDRFGRHIKLPNEPCPGYNVEQCAKKGTDTLMLPYPIKGMDMSFSGVLSAVTGKYNENHKKPEDKQLFKEPELCATLQEHLFSMMVETTERALSVTKLDSVLIVGGVGCNKRLQEMMQLMCEERGATLGATDSRYCIDNGAMIAHTGALMYNHGVFINPFDGAPYTQRYRTDDVEIVWRENTIFQV